MASGSKLEGDFGSKLEGDGDHSKWALTEDIDQEILHMPSLTVSNGWRGAKLTGKHEE